MENSFTKVSRIRKIDFFGDQALYLGEYYMIAEVGSQVIIPDDKDSKNKLMCLFNVRVHISENAENDDDKIPVLDFEHETRYELANDASSSEREQIFKDEIEFNLPIIIKEVNSIFEKGKLSLRLPEYHSDEGAYNELSYRII